MKYEIAIISNNSMRYSPYITFYEQLIKAHQVCPCIINKEYEKGIKRKHNQFIFHQTPEILKANPIIRTYSWYRFLKKVLYKYKIEKLIITPTRTAITIFPLVFLKRKKYIFDIRDYTKEYSLLYRTLERIIIKNSFCTVISSRGFLRWLPKEYNTKYIVAHNIPYNCDFVIRNKQQSNHKPPFIIAYVGFVDYFDTNTRLINAFANKQEFKLVYTGKISTNCKLDEYVKKNDINNVQFTGPYSNENKYEYYRNVDLINALYGDNSLITTTALPNKLYDAVMCGIPILVSKGTYLSEVVDKFNLGISVDVKNDDLYQTIQHFLNNIDYESFNKSCEAFLRIVKEDQRKLEESILKFLSETEETE